MDKKAEAFCAGIFAREIQVKPETMIKRLIIMCSFGEREGIKEPSAFMEITEIEWHSIADLCDQSILGFIDF